MRLAFVGVALAACGGGHTTDIQPTLRIADRSDAEIARLIAAASGGEMFSAQSQVDALSLSTDPCPAIAASGDVVTLSGGCTTQDGVAIGGSATITNPTVWAQVTYREGTDTLYQLDQLSFTQHGVAQTYDGSVRITDGLATYEADITVDEQGEALRSDLLYRCDRTNQSCDLGGSGLELVGAGGVQLSGSVEVGTATRASLTLHGVDTLAVTIAQGCVSWQIDGTDRQQLCQQPL